MGEGAAVGAAQLPAAQAHGELRELRPAVLDRAALLGGRRERGSAEPVVPDLPTFVGVGERAGLERVHGDERRVHGGARGTLEVLLAHVRVGEVELDIRAIELGAPGRVSRPAVELSVTGGGGHRR